MKKIKKNHIFIAILFSSAALMHVGANYENRVWLCEFTGRDICYKLYPPPEYYGPVECASLRRRTGLECIRF